MQKKPAHPAQIRLIESDEAEPRVRLARGKQYEVTVAPIVDNDLRAIADEADAPPARPARLCGSRSTCIALVEIDE